MDVDLSFSSIKQLAGLHRERKLSALELTEWSLDRLESLGPRYNAVAELTSELAKAQARQADAALKRNEGGSLLLGIPYGIKDMFATAGIPTRWGSPAFADQVFDYDATVVEQMRGAGAVLTAKLAMVQFAGAGGYRTAAASLHGPGLNPWNRNYWSGGSSSGSGSAVVAGLIPFAISAETMGSIMTPSAFCGATGLRPSFGAVSRHGALVLAWSLEKVGPISRSAEDCAIVFSAMTGADPRDPTTVEWDYQPSRQANFRIGVLPGELDGLPETQKAFDQALETLQKLGMKLQNVELPPYDYAAIGRTLMVGEAAAFHGDVIGSARLDEFLDETQRDGLRKFLDQPASAYVRAAEQRVAATRDARALFQHVDALIAPTVPTEAPTIDFDLRTWLRRGRYASLGAVAGLPALSVPMGFGPNGLPLGLSIIGDTFAEATILRIGMEFQSETDWHLKRPPVPTADSN